MNSVKELKDLIETYEQEVITLEDMDEQWELYDDPTCDPGLQFEQECKVTKAYNAIVRYAQTLELQN